MTVKYCIIQLLNLKNQTRYKKQRFPFNQNAEDLSTGEFEATVGDILMNIIDESLKNDTVKFRSDDSDESDI